MALKFSEYSERRRLFEAADQSLKFLKNLSQADVDRFASLSDGYDAAKGRWGDESLWIVSAVNRAVKSGKASPDEIWKYAETIRNDVAAFRQYRKELGGNIDRYMDFAELHDAVSGFVDADGKPIPRASKTQMSGRIRSAMAKMKRSGMTVVLDNDAFLISSPETLEVNRTMASVGRWCHTGNKQSGVDDPEEHWDEYTSYGPLYYVLDKARQLVLCVSYARQKEIRNQFDAQPYEVGAGSDKWRLDINLKEGPKPDKIDVEYGNNQKDWEKFTEWLDPTGAVSKAILRYEDEYDEKEAERLQQAFNADYAGLRDKIRDGLLELETKEEVQQFRNMLMAGIQDLPYEEDYEAGGEFEDHDFETDFARVVASNRRELRWYSRLKPLVTEFFKEVQTLRPGKFAKRLFAGITYDGELPEIDLTGADSTFQMFRGYDGTHAPRIINAESVNDVGGMFMGCQKLKDVGDLVFPKAKQAVSVFYMANAIEKTGDLIFPNVQFASDLIPIGAIEVGDIDVMSLDRPLLIFRDLWTGQSRLDKIGDIKFSSDAGLTENYGFGGINRIPRFVFDKFKEKCGSAVLAKLETDENGFVKVKRFKHMDGMRSTPEFAALMMPGLVSGFDLSKADLESVALFLKDWNTPQFKAFEERPYLKISENAYASGLNGADFESLLKDGKLDERYSGKISIVSDDGEERKLSDSEIVLKAENKNMTYDEEGRLVVHNPSDARFAAKHHDELKAIDITKFWDNARYDIAFWIWINNYLHDITVEDDRDEDSWKHYETKLPTIRMTRAQWDHRNDEGPIFKHAPNLAEKYGEMCDGDVTYAGSDILTTMPEFVEIADPPAKSLNEQLRSNGFVRDCAYAMRRFGWC